jgi:hypothetical protein
LYLENLSFLVGVLKSTAYVALIVFKAADEVRITTFFRTFRIKKINKFIVTSNKLTNKFVSQVSSGLWLDVACGPPVGLY